MVAKTTADMILEHYKGINSVLLCRKHKCLDNIAQE